MAIHGRGLCRGMVIIPNPTRITELPGGRNSSATTM